MREGGQQDRKQATNGVSAQLATFVAVAWHASSPPPSLPSTPQDPVSVTGLDHSLRLSPPRAEGHLTTRRRARALLRHRGTLVKHGTLYRNHAHLLLHHEAPHRREARLDRPTPPTRAREGGEVEVKAFDYGDDADQHNGERGDPPRVVASGWHVMHYKRLLAEWGMALGEGRSITSALTGMVGI